MHSTKSNALNSSFYRFIYCLIALIEVWLILTSEREPICNNSETLNIDKIFLNKLLLMFDSDKVIIATENIIFTSLISSIAAASIK